MKLLPIGFVFRCNNNSDIYILYGLHLNDIDFNFYGKNLFELFKGDCK